MNDEDTTQLDMRGQYGVGCSKLLRSHIHLCRRTNQTRFLSTLLTFQENSQDHFMLGAWFQLEIKTRTKKKGESEVSAKGTWKRNPKCPREVLFFLFFSFVSLFEKIKVAFWKKWGSSRLGKFFFHLGLQGKGGIQNCRFEHRWNQILANYGWMQTFK